MPTSRPSCLTTRPLTSTVWTSARWAWNATWPYGCRIGNITGECSFLTSTTSAFLPCSRLPISASIPSARLPPRVAQSTKQYERTQASQMAGGNGRDRRRERVGQDDAARPARRPRPADVGRRRARRRRAVDARPGRLRGAAPAAARLRVPVVPVAARADRARERHAAARARRRGRCGASARDVARARRARAAHDALSAAAVGRRAAARRDRARVRRRAEAADGRRADRQSRRRDRRRSRRPDVPAQSRARHDAAAGHARRRASRSRCERRLSLALGRLVGDERRREQPRVARIGAAAPSDRARDARRLRDARRCASRCGSSRATGARASCAC